MELERECSVEELALRVQFLAPQIVPEHSQVFCTSLVPIDEGC